MHHQRSIGRLISRIHHFSHIHLGRELETYDIGSGQFYFLMRLFHQDGTNQEYLARHLMTDKATSARAIGKLEEAGYITRKRDDSDRRAYQVFLTEKAYEIRPIIKKILKNWTDALLQGFSGDEQTMLFDFLERITANAASESGVRFEPDKEGCQDGG